MTNSEFHIQAKIYRVKMKQVLAFTVPTIENGELGIRVGFSFFLFVFHAKSATTNNHRTGLSDKSY